MDKDCYSEKLCRSRREIFETRFTAMDKALEERTGELERRLEGLNQLRAEVTKDRELLLPRGIYDIKIAYYDKFVTEASNAITRMETRYEARLTFATVMSVFSSIIAILAVVVPWLVHR